MTNNRLENLLKMLESQPEDPFLIYAIAIEYESLGNFVAAEKYLKHVLIKHPDYLPVYYKAGLFYAEKGDLVKAIELLNTGVSLAMLQNEPRTLRELKQAIQDIEDE